MALTGIFNADFAPFSVAVDGAVLKLRDIESGSAKVTDRLNTMGNSFSGHKIIQDATIMAEVFERAGGQASFTEKELARMGATGAEAVAKLRALGQDIPPGIAAIAAHNRVTTSTFDEMRGAVTTLAGAFGIGFGLAQIVSFGKEVIEAGSSVAKMAAQTSLGTDEVQRLMHIAGQTSTPVQSLVSAIQNMQQRIGDDEGGAAGALKHLNINLDEFKALGAYEQFTLAAEGVRNIKDPTEQVNVAAAIFGKNWKEILPAVKAGMREVGDEASIMADGTIKSLDRVDAALKRASQGITSWAGTGAANFIESIERMQVSAGDFFTMFDPSHFGVRTSAILAMAGAMNDPAGLLGAISRIPTVSTPAGDALTDLTLKGSKLKDTENELALGLLASQQAAQAATKAAAELAKAQSDADAIVMVGYQNRIKGLDAMAQASLKAYGFEAQIAALSQLDAAEQALARSVFNSLNGEKERAKVVADWITRHIALMNEETALQLKQAGVVNAAVVAKLEAQAALNAAYGRTASGGLATQQTALEKYDRALQALHDRKQEGISQYAQEQVLLNQYTTDLGELTVVIVGTTAAENEAARVLKEKAGALDVVTQATERNRAATESLLTGLKGLDGKTFTAGVRIEFGQAGWFGWSPGGGGGTWTPPPGRAAGGPVDMGRSYMVGERGPELFTPGANGMISPNGGGGGTTVIVHNTFNLVDTESNLARRVSDLMARSIRSGQQLEAS